MKTVNFYVPIKNLDGKVMKESSEPNAGDWMVNKLVGNTMVQMASRGDAMRQVDIARMIYESTSAIALEDADFDQVKACVSEGIQTCLAKAAVEECLSKAEKKG